MVTYLDKHNNYFTLMMLIIGKPVKLSCRLDCDIPLMAVLKRAEEPQPCRTFSYIIYIINVHPCTPFHSSFFLFLSAEGEGCHFKSFQQSHREDSRRGD